MVRAKKVRGLQGYERRVGTIEFRLFCKLGLELR
jgi:hypothetical protein